MEEIPGVEDWMESTFDKDKDDKLRTIKKKIQEIEEEMDGLKEAIERGKDPKSRESIRVRDGAVLPYPLTR